MPIYIKNEITGKIKPIKINGIKGDPGSPSKISVNGEIYEAVDGIITLPDYSSGTNFTKISQLENDRNYVTSSEMNAAINNIQIESGNIFINDIDITNDIFTLASSSAKGNFILSNTSVTINEGESTSFTISLDKAIESNLTVTLSSTNGNVTLSSYSLTFTPENYSTPQTINITTQESEDSIDWSTIINISADGFNTSKFTLNATNITKSYGAIIVSSKKFTSFRR